MFINRQRLSIMKMPAWFLIGGAAGVENGAAIFGRQTGNLHFFEGNGWDWRDSSPIVHRFGPRPAPLAKSAIRRVVLVLQPEKFEREPVETQAGILGLVSMQAGRKI